MGACMSSDNDDGEQKKRSQAIDRTLEEDKKTLRRECKILLLGVLIRACHAKVRKQPTNQHPTGSGESGKSTIVKQMKIIHQNGYTEDELAQYRHTIYKNVVDCAKALIAAMRQFEIEVEEEKNKEHVEYITEYVVDPEPEATIDEKVGDAITDIWNDPCIPKLLDHANEFYLMDSAP